MEARKNHHKNMMKNKMHDRRRKKLSDLPERHAREDANLQTDLSEKVQLRKLSGAGTRQRV